MSNNYQKAARGCLYALAVVIAGVCFSVKPAQSATCFLPSGNCSTGKIGGGPAPEATPEYCTGYNINQKSYNEKYNNSGCFSCTSCTKTVDDKGTYYKCDEVSGSNWDNQHDKCCTDNTKYDADEGACCPAGGCKHDCPTGKIWSKALKQCVCPSDVETDSNGNCCAKGQVLENGSCTTPCEMNACDGYTYTTDPGNSESCNLGCNKGYRYKCKAGYTYSNGKCEQDKKCDYAYRQATTEDSDNKTGNLDNGNKCTNGSTCWNNLSKMASLYTETGTPKVNPINKISNKSATCVDENGVTKYQTICQGTPKSKCQNSGKHYFEFVSNGCFSTAYDNGFEVKGDEFGDCIEKEEKCFYQYVHLTSKDTGTGDIDGKKLRYGRDYYECSKEGAEATKNSYCYPVTYGGNREYTAYKCGGNLDSSNCTKPGEKCTMTLTCGYVYNCFIYTKCYYAIRNNSSITSVGSGTPQWTALYNKISNKSASCETLDGVTKYETLCDGTPKQKCLSSKKFVPNGCVSDGYDEGVKVLGAEWGTCSCDIEKGAYDTEQECKNATGKGCTTSAGCYKSCESLGYYSTELECGNATGKGCDGNSYNCYQTCESLGYYSTEQECKNTNYAVTCSKVGNCYNRKMEGFWIKYETGEKRRWICYPRNANSYNIEISAFLTDVEKNSVSGLEQSGNYSQTVDGIRYQGLPDDTSKGYQYKAGTYYLCYRGYSGVGLGVRSVQLLKQADYNAEFYYDMCFSGNPSSAGTWGGKSCKAVDYSGGNYGCAKVTFTAGKIYKIRFDYNYLKEGWSYDMGTCTNN